MIETVHHDGRCIKGTLDAVVIAEREAAEYNPVTIANVFPKSITSRNWALNQGASPAVAWRCALSWAKKIGIYWTPPTRNSRISWAIFVWWLSRAKWPLGTKCISALGRSRLKALAAVFCISVKILIFQFLATLLFFGTGFASFIASLVPKVLLMIVSTYLVTSVSSLIGWRVSALLSGYTTRFSQSRSMCGYVRLYSVYHVLLLTFRSFSDRLYSDCTHERVLC